jgi:MFS family permease
VAANVQIEQSPTTVHDGAVLAPTRSGSFIGWLSEGSPAARRSLIAASLGWTLDAFDVMLYSLVLSAIIKEFGLSTTVAGALGALTLLASGVGGMAFGVIADRYGRRVAMMLSILAYSVFTGLSGFVHTVGQLAVCRLLIGLGMGGEWTSGAALVSETWPDRHRAKAMAFMHSFFAVGTAAAAVLVGIVLPRFGWRAVFFLGTTPALLVLWLRRGISESELWLHSRSEPGLKQRVDVGHIFRGHYGRLTLLLTLLSLFTLFAYWGLNFWIPAYLSLPDSAGGLGLSTSVSTRIIVATQFGLWLGLVTFGHVCDWLGRRVSNVVYLVIGAVFVLLYTRTHNPAMLLVLGPLVAFFGTGQLAGFGVTSGEVYPTSIRAAAQGFTFNVGRLGSAFAPFIAGSLARSHGYGVAFGVTAVALLLAAVVWFWLPETKGRTLA